MYIILRSTQILSEYMLRPKFQVLRTGPVTHMKGLIIKFTHIQASNQLDSMILLK